MRQNSMQEMISIAVGLPKCKSDFRFLGLVYDCGSEEHKLLIHSFCPSVHDVSDVEG